MLMENSKFHISIACQSDQSVRALPCDKSKQASIAPGEGLMPVDCPGSCKRASCGVQGHAKVCRLNCSSCNPGDQRNPRSRPPAKKKRRLVRGAAVSYAEQDESEDLLFDSEEELQGCFAGVNCSRKA